MTIVTLTTDLGIKDYYVGSLKGALLSECPDIQIVDLSHEIEPFDIMQASIIIKHCFRDFPEGSIHIIGVNPDVTEDTRHLVVYIHKQYFIMPDNGIFSLIFDSKPDEVIALNLIQQSDLLTFPAKDIYVKAACHLSRGGSLQVIGNIIDDMAERVNFRAVSDERIIRGMVVYIDHYGNALTNIDQNLFRQFNKYPSFTIRLRRTKDEITKIHKTYSEVHGGDKIAIFNTMGKLEISINQGNASQLMNIKQSDTITIEFHDH